MAETQSPPAPADTRTDEVLRALAQKASGLPPEMFEAEQARIDEYAVWVAVQDIDYGGVRAYNLGDAVPNANVDELKYDELGWVAKRTTKAGKAAIAAATGIEA